MKLSDLKSAYILTFDPKQTKLPRDFSNSIKKNLPALLIISNTDKIRYAIVEKVQDLTEAHIYFDLALSNEKIAAFNSKLSSMNPNPSGRVEEKSQDLINLWKETTKEISTNDDVIDKEDPDEYKNDLLFTKDQLPGFLRKNISEINVQKENDPALIAFAEYVELLSPEEKATVMDSVRQHIAQSKHANKNLWLQSFLERLLPGKQEEIANSLSAILKTTTYNSHEDALIKSVTQIVDTAIKNEVPITGLLNKLTKHQVVALFQQIYPIFQRYHTEKKALLKQYINAFHDSEKIVNDPASQKIIDKLIKDYTQTQASMKWNSLDKTRQKNVIKSLINMKNKGANKDKILQPLEFFVKSLIHEKSEANTEILNYLAQSPSHSSPMLAEKANEKNLSSLMTTIYQLPEHDEDVLKAHAQLIATLQDPNTLASLADSEGAFLKQAIDALKVRQLYVQRGANQLQTKKAEDINMGEAPVFSEAQQLSADAFILDVLKAAEIACENNPQAQNMLSAYYYNALEEYNYADIIDAMENAANAAANATAKALIGDEAAQYNSSLMHTFGFKFPFDVMKNAYKLPPNAWLNVIDAVGLEDLKSLGKSINIPLEHIIENNKLEILLERLANNIDEKLDNKAEFLFKKTLDVLARNQYKLSETTCEKLIKASLSRCGNMKSILDLLDAYSASTLKPETKRNLFNAVIKSPVYAAYLINNPETLWKYLKDITITEADLTSNANHSEPYTLEGVKINHCLLAKYFSQFAPEAFSDENLSADVQGRFKYFNAALVPPAILKQLSSTLKEKIILSFKHPSTFTRSLIFEDSTLFDAVTTGFTSHTMQKFFETFLKNQCLGKTGCIAQYHQHNIMTAFFRYFKQRGQETSFWECVKQTIPSDQMKDFIHTHIFSNRTCMEAMADVGEDSFYKLATHDANNAANRVWSFVGYEIKPDRYKVLTLDILTPLVETYLINPSEAIEKVLSDWLLLQFKNAFDKAKTSTQISTTTADATVAEIERVLLKNDKIMAELKNQINLPIWSQLLGNPAFRQAWKTKYFGSESNLERLLDALYEPNNLLQDMTENLNKSFYNTEGKLVLGAANEDINLSFFGAIDHLKTETLDHFGSIFGDKISGSIKTIDYALIHSANKTNTDVDTWKKLFEDYVGSLRRESNPAVDLEKELPEIEKTIAYALGGSQSKNDATKEMAEQALDVLLKPEHLLYFKTLYEKSEKDSIIRSKITSIIKMMFMANAPELLKTLASSYRAPEYDWIVNDVLNIKGLLEQPTTKETENQQLDNRANYWHWVAVDTGIVKATEIAENGTKAAEDTVQAWWQGITPTELNTCREIAHVRAFEKEQQFQRSGSFGSLGILKSLGVENAPKAGGGFMASVERAEKYSGKYNNPTIKSPWLYAATRYLGLNKTELKSKHVDKSWREETPIYYESQEKKSNGEAKLVFRNAKDRKAAFPNDTNQKNEKILKEEKEKRKNQYVDMRPSVKAENKKSRTRQYLDEFLKDPKNSHTTESLKAHLSFKPKDESVNANLTDMEAVLKLVESGATEIAGTTYSRSSNTTLAWWYYQTIGYVRDEKAVKEDDHLTPLKAMLIEMAIEENQSKDNVIDCMLSIVKGEEKAIALLDAASEEDIKALEKIITDSSTTIEKYLSQLMEKKTLPEADLKDLSDMLASATSAAIRIRRFSDASTAVAKTSEWFNTLRNTKDIPVARKILTDVEFKCANVSERLLSNRRQDLVLEKEKLLEIEDQANSMLALPKDSKKILENEIKNLEAKKAEDTLSIEGTYPIKKADEQQMRYSPGRLFAVVKHSNTQALESPDPDLVASAAG